MTTPLEPQSPTIGVLCNYLVAFVDLMGQSAKLLEFEHADQIEPDSEQFRVWLKKTYGTVTRFRSGFFDFIDKMNKPRESSRVPDQFNSTDVHMIPASDSIVIYTALYDNDGSRAVQNTNSVVAIFRALGALAPMFIAFGTPFRAGLTIGLGLESEEIGFYGPALPLSFELEKSADYPRILVDPYVLEFLNEFHDREIDSIQSKFLIYQASLARSMIFQDRDHHWAIDFLGTPIRELYARTVLTDIDPFVDGYNRIQESIENEKDLKIRCKYLLLKEYYDSRASIWLKNGAHP